MEEDSWSTCWNGKKRTSNQSSETVIQQLEEEGYQEADLHSKDFVGGYPQIIGIAHAKAAASENRPRWEALGFGQLNIDSHEVRTRVKEALTSPTAESIADFAEGDIRFLDATSKTIEQLVQMQSYWPTTHLAGLLAVGCIFKAQELANELGVDVSDSRVFDQMEQWVQMVAMLADDTYDSIDRRVRDFYAANPKLKQQRKMQRIHTDTYDPTIPPSHTEDPKDPGQVIIGQGLPTVDEELERLFS